MPAQIWLGQSHNLGVNQVLWWRTYSPPVWLLNGNEMQVTDLMGMEFKAMQAHVEAEIGPSCNGLGVGLVAPRSSMDLDAWMQQSHAKKAAAKGEGRKPAKKGDLVFEEIWRYPRHIGLDDLDVPREGVWGTLKRVIGRRGLSVWRIRRRCEDG